jgi:hypothetical protein
VRRQQLVLEHGEVREQVELLKHHPDLAPDLLDRLDVVGQRHAVDDDRAFLVLLQPVDAADQRRLARAGGTGDHDALAARHLEVDVLQHVEVAEPLVDAGEADDRIGFGHGGLC